MPLAIAIMSLVWLYALVLVRTAVGKEADGDADHVETNIGIVESMAQVSRDLTRIEVLTGKVRRTFVAKSSMVEQLRRGDSIVFAYLPQQRMHRLARVDTSVAGRISLEAMPE